MVQKEKVCPDIELKDEWHKMKLGKKAGTCHFSGENLEDKFV